MIAMCLSCELSSGTWYSVMAHAIDGRDDISQKRVEGDVRCSSVHMSSEGVRGNLFHGEGLLFTPT